MIDLVNDLMRFLTTPRSGPIEEEVFVSVPERGYGTRSSTVVVMTEEEVVMKEMSQPSGDSSRLGDELHAAQSAPTAATARNLLIGVSARVERSAGCLRSMETLSKDKRDGAPAPPSRRVGRRVPRPVRPAW